MKKTLLICALALLPLGLMAQEQERHAYDSSASSEQNPAEEQQTQESPKKEKKKTALFTGFSGGMMVHGGYLFSDDPRKVFSNSGLGDASYVKGLPKSRS